MAIERCTYLASFQTGLQIGVISPDLQSIVFLDYQFLEFCLSCIVILLTLIAETIRLLFPRDRRLGSRLIP